MATHREDGIVLIDEEAATNRDIGPEEEGEYWDPDTGLTVKTVDGKEVQLEGQVKDAAKEEETGTEPEKTAEKGETDEEPTVDADEGLKKRIAELEKKFEASERRASYYRRIAEREASEYIPPPGEQGERVPAAPVAGRPGEPVLQLPNEEEFETYEEYLDARSRAIVGHEIEKYNYQARVNAERHEVEQRQETLRGRISEGFTRYDDFEAVALDESLPITTAMSEIMADMERAADVAYYLGKNREVCQSIAAMTPMAAARELAKIEIRIEAEIAEAGEPKAREPKKPPEPKKKPSSAPPPISPLKASGAGSPETDPNKMGFEEYKKARREGRIR